MPRGPVACDWCWFGFAVLFCCIAHSQQDTRCSARLRTAASTKFTLASNRRMPRQTQRRLQNRQSHLRQSSASVPRRSSRTQSGQSQSYCECANSPAQFAPSPRIGESHNPAAQDTVVDHSRDVKHRAKLQARHEPSARYEPTHREQIDMPEAETGPPSHESLSSQPARTK